MWARSKRWAMPWKVPIHMPRTPSPITFSTRPRISAAALLVKVTAMMEKGEQRSTCISQAIRCTSTRVLPEPAPASTSRLLRGAATASLCLSLSPSSRVETSITTPVYLYRRGLYGHPPCQTKSKLGGGTRWGRAGVPVRPFLAGARENGTGRSPAVANPCSRGLWGFASRITGLPGGWMNKRGKRFTVTC